DRWHPWSEEGRRTGQDAAIQQPQAGQGTGQAGSDPCEHAEPLISSQEATRRRPGRVAGASSCLEVIFRGIGRDSGRLGGIHAGTLVLASAPCWEPEQVLRHAGHSLGTRFEPVHPESERGDPSTGYRLKGASTG